MPVPWVFTDPRHDPYNPMQYIASNTLTAIAICECLLASLYSSARRGLEEGTGCSYTTVAFLGTALL